MKRISYWARNNKKNARFIIIVSFILVTGLGIVTGTLLNELGIIISSKAMLIFICAYLIGLAAYPTLAHKMKKRNPAQHYIKQKTCDLVLAASSFCMVVYFSNQPFQLFQNYTSLNASVSNNIPLPKDSSLKAYKSISAFAGSLKDANGKSLSWKEKKKLLKEQVRNIKKAKDISEGEKTGLIILSVIVALGLLFLVASLSCSLSCAGSEGAAVLVGIGGTALIIFLLIITIRAILGKKNKRKTFKDVRK